MKFDREFIILQTYWTYKLYIEIIVGTVSQIQCYYIAIRTQIEENSDFPSICVGCFVHSPKLYNSITTTFVDDADK